jgi:hypothetical protein
MGKVVLAAAIVAILAGAGCSGSKSSNNNPFPYSGPSCQGGPPGATANVACSTCAQNQCTSATNTQCIDVTCQSYLTCVCNCAVGSISCLAGCTMPSACGTCLTTVTACYGSAQTGAACASECSVSDAGGGGG